jgi:hypothetical protein
MIIGAHSIIYSANAKADREFFRNVLKLSNIDVGDGWLIFGLPPSEIAIHPANKSGLHELYLMCKNVGTFVKRMEKHGIACSPIRTQRWGLLTELTLPGGGTIGVYQPRHTRPRTLTIRRVKKSNTKRARASQ